VPAPLVLAALLAWVAVSLAAQFGAFGRAPFLIRYLAPRWALFTVSPALMSVTAWYRLEDGSGALGVWQPLPPPRARPWHVAVWGVERRLGKIHSDLAMALVQHRLRSPRSEAPTWPAYRVLLGMAVAAAASAGECRVQFCLRTEQPGWPEQRSRVLFLSELHPAP